MLPLNVQEVPALLQLEFTAPLTVTLPLTAQDTVELTGCVAALLPCSGACCAGALATALKAAETMVMMSAESCAEKVPVVGSTQLEPPQLTSAAAAATAIRLCIGEFPPALRVRPCTSGRQGTGCGDVRGAVALANARPRFSRRSACKGADWRVHRPT